MWRAVRQLCSACISYALFALNLHSISVYKSDFVRLNQRVSVVCGANWIIYGSSKRIVRIPAEHSAQCGETFRWLLVTNTHTHTHPHSHSVYKHINSWVNVLLSRIFHTAQRQSVNGIAVATRVCGSGQESVQIEFQVQWQAESFLTIEGKSKKKKHTHKHINANIT